MDNLEINNMIAEMGVKLAQLAVKRTATAINVKIESIKTERDAQKIRSTYEEIINELLSERQEIIRIAQSYEEELNKVVISDEDIQHLHKTVTRILEIFKYMNPQNQNIDSFEKCKNA